MSAMFSILDWETTSLQGTVFLCSICLLSFYVASQARYRRFLALTPPGPKPIPLLGNAFDLPRDQDWATYAHWAKVYNSSLISIRAFGQLTIVINSAEAAKELLGRRSANYSDKPRLAMLELMEWDWNTAFLRHGDKWRARRRLLHRALNVAAVSAYYPLQERFARKLLVDLHRKPRSFAEHVERLTAGVSFYVAYALEDDALMDAPRRAFQLLSQSVFRGAQILNTFPLLKCVPEWFPGTGYHAFARESRELTRKMRFGPLAEVKKQMERGTARPSLAQSMLRSSNGEIDKETIADVAAIIFAGGGDTSLSAICAGIRALVLYPEIQQRAQAELDTVIGRGRLPNYADRPSLPYINAICYEILRWFSTVPLGTPHVAREDDLYDGWLIPAGSTIVWNAWAISHDPETYQDPHKFVPERFLDEYGQLTRKEEETAFGYGRRACVGLHFAKSTLWVTIASILSVYNLNKAKDENGNEIEIPLGQTNGLVSHPLPFECDISPRDEKALGLLKSISFNEV